MLSMVFSRLLTSRVTFLGLQTHQGVQGACAAGGAVRREGEGPHGEAVEGAHHVEDAQAIHPRDGL
jgi:hypothetical protein